MGMKRREFARLLSLIAMPQFITGAPQESRGVRRVGALLLLVDDELGRSRFAEFQRRLRELGWTAGGNLQIDVRWAGDDQAKRLRYAAELVAAKPDVILALGTAGVQALRNETVAIPVVFVQVTDPLEAGVVASLSSPTGNITGFANFGALVGAERLRVLKEIAPQVRRVLVVRETNPAAQLQSLLRSIDEAARQLRIEVVGNGMRDAGQLEGDIDEFARQSNGGLVVNQGPFTTAHRERIVALADRHRLPAVYPLGSFVEIGGLVSYGVNVPHMWQDAAGYVDRILRGAKIRDLPVQEPSEPEILVNAKAARKLDIAIPPMLRARITRVVG
jgi:putative ABC transport system substrate-binding protein